MDSRHVAEIAKQCLRLALQALLLAGGERLPYDRLCVCTGAEPKGLPAEVYGPAPHSTATHQVGGPAPAAARAPAAAAQAPSAAGEGQQRLREAVAARVLTVRDTHSVAQLAAALHGARRVAVVGNGGIALELM